MGSKPFQAVMSNCYVIENKAQRRLAEHCAEKDVKKRGSKPFFVENKEDRFGSKPFFGFKAILGRKAGCAMLLKKIKLASIQKSWLWFEAVFEVQSH